MSTLAFEPFARIEELKSRIEALEADNKVFSDNMIALKDENTLLQIHIEVLESSLQQIADIGEGSTTANSLPHVAKIARAALVAV